MDGNMENDVGLNGRTCSLVTHPPLSCLTPMGTGTAQTECLTSYLMRLAAAHCLSPGTLYGHEIYPLVRG
jgi:hypothetical protein